jgi:hypothetical protein
MIRVAAAGVWIAAAVAVGATAPGAAPQAVKLDTEGTGHMKAHFHQVLTIHDAVARADLAAARGLASWLATHEPPASVPPSTMPYVAEMQAAAKQVVAATNVLDAALASASMLKTCGDCHQAAGVVPALPEIRRPDVGGLVGHMLEHQTSAEHMARGLIAPSATEWRTGAQGFARDPFRRDAVPRGMKVPASLLEAEGRIHAVAEQALRAQDPAARAVFYGQILARCAECHDQHRALWGPTKR